MTPSTKHNHLIHCRYKILTKASLSLYHSTTKLLLSMYHFLSVFMVLLKSFSWKSPSQGQQTILKAFSHQHLKLIIDIFQSANSSICLCQMSLQREKVHEWYKNVPVNIRDDEPTTHNVLCPPHPETECQLSLTSALGHSILTEASRSTVRWQFFPETPAWLGASWVSFSADRRSLRVK